MGFIGPLSELVAKALERILGRSIAALSRE
jgi:hypothetical protein